MMNVRQDKRSIHGMAGVVLLLAACSAGDSTSTVDRSLAVGTWGGANAGVIVGDSVAHVHVGCTFGDFRVPVFLGFEGRFEVIGSYVLRAYPVQIGPSLPARFSGMVQNNKLNLTVIVEDTVEKKTVVKGPVTVYLGQQPQLDPCPICSSPGMSLRYQKKRVLEADVVVDRKHARHARLVHGKISEGELRFSQSGE
jgi:hypothetical protein